MRSWVLLASCAYPMWLAMTAAHEAGHALHAWASGGRVTAVEVPLIGFSRTDVSPNPHPQFVAWGGAAWGCLIPLLVWRAARVAGRGVTAARVFAGFCLVANGAYLSAGPLMTAGDGFDLVRAGAPAAFVHAVGAAMLAGGLAVWHRTSTRTTPT